MYIYDIYYMCMHIYIFMSLYMSMWHGSGLKGNTSGTHCAGNVVFV